MPAPSTMNVGKKKLSKNVVYIGGAVAAGFVGYAWWTKGKSAASDVPVAAVDETAPVDVPTDSTGFTVGSSNNAVPNPANNAEWSELALERLIAIGLDGPAVSAAIGRFLQHIPLNKVDASLVEQAIRAAGYPPVGGPWVIIRETAGVTTPVVTTPSITAVVTPGKAVFSWHPPAGILSSQVAREQSGHVSQFTDIGNRSSYTWTGLKHGGGYRLHVRYRYPSGVYSQHGTAYVTGK